MATWKSRDARDRFSELVDRALTEGPQVVTRRGKNAVVIVAHEQYAALAPTADFKSFLLSSAGVCDLPLIREKRSARSAT